MDETLPHCWRLAVFDSDGDGFTNQAEIVALTYPGDANDDPTKVPAPSRVISLKELEEMPLHTQFLLMNASKSDDSYTKYSGVALENLIKAIMLDSATGITVYSPDGFATYHPFNPSTNPNSYHVFGIYPQGTFYYNERADIAIYPPDPHQTILTVAGVIIVPHRQQAEQTVPLSLTRKV